MRMSWLGQQVAVWTVCQNSWTWLEFLIVSKVIPKKYKWVNLICVLKLLKILFHPIRGYRELLCEARWSIYFSWLGCGVSSRGGRLHFKSCSGYALYLFHSQTSTTVYLPRTELWNDSGNFPINTQSNIPVKRKQACVWRHKQGGSAAGWLASSPLSSRIFWQASLPVFVFDITYLWVEPPLTEPRSFYQDSQDDLYTGHRASSEQNFHSFFYFHQSFQACFTHSFQEALLQIHRWVTYPSSRTWGMGVVASP